LTLDWEDIKTGQGWVRECTEEIKVCGIFSAENEEGDDDDDGGEERCPHHPGVGLNPFLHCGDTFEYTRDNSRSK